jgi:uncharacterized protein YkwD
VAAATLSIAAIITAGCDPAQVVTTASSNQATATPESRLLSMLNADRAAVGAPALRLNTGASSLAEGWSATMARQNRLMHNPDLGGALTANGVTGWRAASENVGYSTAGVDDVHHQFMNSGPHRANIQNAGADDVGIGVVESGGTTWVTLVFVDF